MKTRDENAVKLFGAVFIFTAIHKGPFFLALLFQMPAVLTAYLCQLMWQSPQAEVGQWKALTSKLMLMLSVNALSLLLQYTERCQAI